MLDKKEKEGDDEGEEDPKELTVDDKWSVLKKVF